MDELLASIDGTIQPVGEAMVPATDAGLIRGDGVFEVTRVYAGRLFAWEDHLRRMTRSAAGLKLEVDLGAVRGEVAALMQRAPDFDGQLRVMVTRGGHRIALLEELAHREATVTLATVTYVPTRILDQIKSLSYAANMLATRTAQEQGADEALLVTPHGRVLEAPTSSFFYAAEAALHTPPLSDHILDSITRRRLIEITGATERIAIVDDLRGASTRRSLRRPRVRCSR